MITLSKIKQTPLIEKVKYCPACNTNTPGKPFMYCKDYLTKGGRFGLEKCEECGLVFTNPKPQNRDLSLYYQSENYDSHQVKPNTLNGRIYVGVRKLMLQRKLRLLEGSMSLACTLHNNEITIGQQGNSGRIEKKKRVLDVGCGAGSFLHIARSRGLETVGVESDARASSLAAANNNSNEPMIIYSDLVEMAAKEAKPFDAITLWHVLEHLPELTRQLSIMTKSLADQGVLVVAVPNKDSYDAAIYKEYWAAYDLPRHLYHFNRNSLERLMKQAGFYLLKRKTLPFDSYYIALLSERYRATLPKPLQILRGVLIGFISHLMSVFNIRPASGEVFVFKKRTSQSNQSVKNEPQAT